MALGSGQYNWQDPLRNAGIIAQSENNDFKNNHKRKGNRKAGMVLIVALIIVLFAVIMLFAFGQNSLL